MQFNASGGFFILSSLVNLSGNVKFSDYVFGIVTSISLAIATILMAISANKMKDSFSWFTYALSFIPFCVFSVVLPVFSGIFLLIYSIVLLIIIEMKEEDRANNVHSIVSFALITILCVITGIMGAASNSSKIEKQAQSVTSFSEIRNYLNLDTVALNLVALDENDCGKILTTERCETLILIGNKEKVYNGLIVETYATEVVLKNIRISDGYVKINSDNATLVIYGYNEIVGINGKNASQNSGNGVTGSSGGNGTATIYASNLEIKGNGRIELTAGNGGNGSNGTNGNSAFLFGSGSDGGHGGNGGDSGYVVDCIRLFGNDFNGKIVLNKGSAGQGGLGGKGGSAGLFGSSGSNGYNGSAGKVRDYVSGELDLPIKFVVYN